MGLNTWDKTALTSAKLLALGFGAARTYDEPRNDNFVINNGDWYIYYLGGEYNLIFVKNLRHNLSFGYPSPSDMIKYKEGKADPNPINEQTSLVLQQTIAIINNISSN